MKPITTAYDYPEVQDPDEEFDYSSCVVVCALEENPEYSSHDFRQIASLTWYTHVADHKQLPHEWDTRERKCRMCRLRELDEDPEEFLDEVECKCTTQRVKVPKHEEDVCAFNHDMLDAPVRFREDIGSERVLADVGHGAGQRIVEVPEDTGIVSPYTKLGREDGMDEDLFEQCLDNLTENLEEMDGVTVADHFEGKVKKTARNMRQEPEWQHREDEIFCRAVEKYARIHNPNAVEHYKHPSQRPKKPEWLESQQRHQEETGENLVRSDAEKEAKLHEDLKFRREPCETFTTEEITNAQP